MKVILSVGVCSAALAALGAATLLAQNAPVAVPIVGSPAAQQPAAPPAQPPQVPAQPPPYPGQSPQMPPAQSAAPAPASRGAVPSRGERKLELAFNGGTLALEAQNVTVREILMEWQRRSGCQFVNADKLPASQVTLQFAEGTPQLDVLDSLLRGLGTGNTGYGYIVGPRNADGLADAACGAVYILPTSRPTASASYMPPAGSPVAAPLVMPGSPDDEIPPVVPFPPGAQPGQPRVIMPPGVPNQPPQMPPNVSSPAGSSGPPQPAVQSPGFGPVAPSAPGAGRVGSPPPTPPPGTGRGGA